MIAPLLALTLLVAIPPAGGTGAGTPTASATSFAPAQRARADADTSRIEVRHADKVEYDGNERTVTLTGAVHIVRGTLSVRAERVVVTMTPDEKRVQSAVATVRVEVIDGTKRARAERAVFLGASSEITLTGSPRLWEGPNEMEADKIVYNIDAKTMRAEGRVRGLFLPSSAP
jgi:lipopolysaccharide transport protein LptA